MSRTLSKEAKKRVFEELRETGFTDTEIRQAIQQFGYDVRKCGKYLAARYEKKELYAGMDVWYFNAEDHAWIHANIVSITRALVALIFKGNDFKWLEKDSEMFTTEEDRPEVEESEAGSDVASMAEYSPPREDEIDYVVTFSEPTLGLKLLSDEKGFGCVVFSCLSTFSTQNVARSSHIIEVNDEWLGAQPFEVIRDHVKKAAKRPPVKIKFRIQIEYLPKGAHWQRLLEEALASGPASDYSSSHREARGKRPAALKSRARGVGHDYLEAEEKQAQPMRETDSIPGGEEPFVPHMDAASAERLQPGDHIDHRDDVGRYLLAVIVEKHGTRLKVHYEGWNPKWDVYSDYNQELFRFAAPKSISRQAQKKMLHVKVRDYIDINPVHRHCGWRFGQVRRVDKYSGQVQVVYKEGGAEYLYWVHLNNPEEAAPFMSKADETLRVKKDEEEYDSRKKSPPSPKGALPPRPPRRKGRASGRYPPPRKDLPAAAGSAPKKKRGTKKWTCPMCGAANDMQHDACIHCRTARVQR